MLLKKVLTWFSLSYVTAELILLLVVLIYFWGADTTQNVEKASTLISVALIQSIAILGYLLLGLFLIILLKRKINELKTGWFALWYILHFLFFVFPTLAYLFIMFMISQNITPGADCCA